MSRTKSASETAQLFLPAWLDVTVEGIQVTDFMSC